MLNLPRNSSGFTIIEVLASLAILTVVALGVAKVNADMAKTSVGTQSVQQRTNLEQSLNAIFENSEVCTTILSGTTSAVGTQIVLPDAVLKTGNETDNVLKKVKLESLTISDIVNLTSNNYRALLLAQGHKSSAVNEIFSSKIPVYYSVNGTTIANCYSSRSPYSTCLALKGVWKDTYCDFCAGLGGTRDPSTGVCSIAQAPPAQQPSAPPPSTRYTLITSASDRNGVRPHAIAGNFKQCKLIGYHYDGDGIGQCSVVNRGGGNWDVIIGDEGTAEVQTCTMACVDTNIVDMGGTEDGDLCTANGKSGIRMNGCCATGTNFQVVFTQPRNGKNASPQYVRTDNDIGCF
jgi:prepilin-type N-terminal cleavage/methylation domain-containing protein